MTASIGVILIIIGVVRLVFDGILLIQDDIWPFVVTITGLIMIIIGGVFL